MFEAVWLFVLLGVFAAVAGTSGANTIYLLIGARSMTALAGYLVMQIGLWRAERRWDEDGSAAWLEAVSGVGGKDVKSQTPEELEAKYSGGVATIPEDKLKAAFPTPWGFLVGWWLWGISYLFPLDGSTNVSPTVPGVVACVICFFVSYVASLPMADSVMHRLLKKKTILSVMFLLGWIALGVASSLDATAQVAKSEPFVWILCMLGPVTIVLSQKILFGARKMGTLWEASGAPNFHPVVYNMGGPLFVFGWFLLFLGTSGLPGVASMDNIYAIDDSYAISSNAVAAPYIPLFLNARTLLSFVFGCGMVPIVRFLDYAHDEDGKWLGENPDGKVFEKWWLGTDGTYFGVFLESPWPFVLFWTGYGLSAFLTFDNGWAGGWREIVLLVNCLLQGVDAGILIQQNLYAGNIAGKMKFSIPFVLLFLALAINIGSRWNWLALAFALPGAMLIVLGQKTVFGDRKRGDYTMQNGGKANPYDKVLVYSWGEVFFMIGWILICWGQAMPL